MDTNKGAFKLYEKLGFKKVTSLINMAMQVEDTNKERK
jgi:ribosomal protein S18 acetylase RimI-like enzyme